jgi:hypothetical protein
MQLNFPRKLQVASDDKFHRSNEIQVGGSRRNSRCVARPGGSFKAGAWLRDVYPACGGVRSGHGGDLRTVPGCGSPRGTPRLCSFQETCCGLPVSTDAGAVNGKSECRSLKRSRLRRLKSSCRIRISREISCESEHDIFRHRAGYLSVSLRSVVSCEVMASNSSGGPPQTRTGLSSCLIKTDRISARFIK